MKKLRIVLLAITAVIAVFSFSTMLAVRPGQHSAVLEAARERQRVPILSVTEPLETNTDQIAEEERIARLVADILISDDAFIGGVSDKVEAAIPGYITEWVESDEFSAIMDEALENSITEIVDRVIAELVTDENIDYVASIVAERLGTSEEEVYVTAFSRIATRVLSMLTLPDGNELDIESVVRSMYFANRDAIIYDVVSDAIAQYDELTTEEKIELLATDEQAAAIYADEREYIIADIVGSIIEQYDALTTEEKIGLLATDEQAATIYADERDYIIADIIGAAVAEYDALTTDEKIEVLSADDIILALYGYNREALMDDIAYELVSRIEDLTAEEKAELFGSVDVAAEVIELYEENKEYIVEEFLDIILAKYGTVPAETSYEEPPYEEEPVSEEKPARPIITVPVFDPTPSVSDDASADEYMDARSSAREAEIARLLEYINF